MWVSVTLMAPQYLQGRVFWAPIRSPNQSTSPRGNTMAVRARLPCGTTEGLVALHCPLHGDASTWKMKHELCLRGSDKSKQPRWEPGNASNDWHYFKACRSMAAPACLSSALSCLSHQPGAPWGLQLSLPRRVSAPPPLYLPRVSTVSGWKTWGSKSAQCTSCLLKHRHFHFGEGNCCLKTQSYSLQCFYIYTSLIHSPTFKQREKEDKIFWYWRYFTYLTGRYKTGR